jgi:hypothetical protein
LAENRIAVRTKSAAGRAWRSTLSGSLTLTPVQAISELGCTAGLLGCTRDIAEWASHRGDHGRRYGAFYERGVHELGVPVALALEDVTDGEDRTAQIPEDDDAVALVGTADRVAHEPVIGAERSLRPPACDLDADIGTRDLACELRDPARQIGAVRDHYDANQLDLPS